ncbi:39S ribosomal protein L20, mitochondrial [Lutzomyia longipalpis]|uniref:Large ribosomal subunit protein bL20m n=1 Tax=Lutzomyia longipalpis TaxID=7200 RepID=A0A1B0CUR3_LUTLO|nr:39S ribosomal protein L20, mitochondrial [Lutzomyia longipalpis]
MVFTTVVNFIRARGPDEFWRKRKIFKLSAHFVGRKRNCYSLAIRNVHRALQYATKGRELKKRDMSDLWSARVAAGCEQHGISFYTFMESLQRCNILLNKKVLSELAAWEPRTFEALARIAREKATVDELPDVKNKDVSSGVITRSTLK